MRRALVNLLDNAREAVQNANLPHPESVVVRVALYDRETVHILIEDRGPGVPENLQPRLFDPYFTTKADGTGLGLAIVRKIIIDHGGDITVQSPIHDDGSGARMRIQLPRVAPTDPQDNV